MQQEKTFSFRIQRITVLGIVKDSAIILDAIRQAFFTKSAAVFTSVRVNFGQPPLSLFATSSLQSPNGEYHQY
jgi:hypothetical protein